MTTLRARLASGAMPLALLLTNGAAGAQPAQTAPRRAVPPAKPSAAPAAIGGVVISRQAVTDATVRAVYGLDKAEATLTVAPREPRAWDFAADVVPILTRQGCNAGGCHGKADGQNGFHLSLFGYDPEGDYRQLTRDDGGRRRGRGRGETGDRGEREDEEQDWAERSGHVPSVPGIDTPVPTPMILP